MKRTVSPEVLSGIPAEDAIDKNLEDSFVSQEGLSRRDYAELWERINRQIGPVVKPAIERCLRVSKADAADIWEEVLVIAFLKRRRFDPGRGRLIPWCFGIARKIGLKTLVTGNSRGSRSATVRLPQKSLEDKEALDPCISLADSQRVGELLRSLLPADADLLRMRYLKGWAMKEIASHLGKSEKAVQSRIYRLLKKLRTSRLPPAQERNSFREEFGSCPAIWDG